MSSRIDVAPLQEAFLRSGLTATELCNRLEWLTPGDRPDTTRLKRALGLLPIAHYGENECARRIGIDRAALIADALNVDPFEVGL